MSKRLRKSIIQPRKGWQVFNWTELLHYKDLLYFMVKKDLQYYINNQF